MLKRRLLGDYLDGENLLHLFAQCKKFIDRHGFPFALHERPHDHASY
jgi:hypothetical protein